MPRKNPYRILKYAPAADRGRWYEFGRFRVDARAHVVLRGRTRLRLTPKAVETLAVLLEHAGSLVPTDLLMEAIWPGSFVEVGSLTRNVSDLRKALGNEAFIETVKKRGYRFTAPVRTFDVAKVAATRKLVVRTAGSAREESDDAAASMVARALVDKLGHIPGCEPRLATGLHDEDDGADLAVELTVRRLRAALRVGVRFVGPRSGASVWAETLEGPDDADGFESVSEQLAGAVALWFSNGHKKALSKRYTGSPQAYREYLRAHFHAEKRTAQGLEEAIRGFRRSIYLDSEYAHAFAGLAASYALVPMLAPLDVRRYMAKARVAAINALEIDETLAEARSALAFVKWHYDWDWAGAEREFRRILRFHPTHAVTRQWYALLLVEQGRSSEAIEQAVAARRLDPASPAIHANMATVFFLAGRHGEALREVNQLLSENPGSVRARLVAGLVLEQQGRFEEAIWHLERALAVSPRVPAVLGALGHVYSAAGRTAQATSIARKFRQPGAWEYAKALTALGRGSVDQALQGLEHAASQKDFQLVLLKVDPRLEVLRGSPRFQAIARRVGLAD